MDGRHPGAALGAPRGLGPLFAMGGDSGDRIVRLPVWGGHLDAEPSGMFVQSEKFIEAHGGQRDDASIHGGQESGPATWRQ